ARLHEVRIGRRDRRLPAQLRVLVMRGGAEGDELAGRPTVATRRAGDVFPAAVEARRDAVDLIVLVRSVLGVPQAAGDRIERQAEAVADAVGVDVRQRARAVAVERV